MKHRARRILPYVLFAMASVALPTSAFAQGTPVDAEELFKQGRAALQVHDYAVACDKLSASLRIERAVGTLMSLADCEEATNKLASAREHWQEGGDLADATFDRIKRGPICRRRFAELDARVPRLTIRSRDTLSAGTVVKRDGVTLVAAALNMAMPVDPGAHTVEILAAGHEPRRVLVDLAEGQAKVIDADAGLGRAAPEAGSSTTTRGSGMGPVFWGGVGVAGVGTVVGIAFGAVALSQGGDLSSACTNHVCSTPSAQSDYSAAKSTSLASDLGFAFAGAGAVVAAVGFFMHRREATEPHPAAFWVGPGSVGVRGVF